jgi:hypothetical protein
MNSRQVKSHTRKLLQLLSRYDVPAVYVEDIADFLGSSRDAVEKELSLLCEDGFLWPVFNAHCGICGNIMGSYESPRGVEVGTGIAECLHCMSQQKVLASDLVSAWVVCKESEDGDEYRFDDPNLTVIGSRSHMITAEKDDFVDEANGRQPPE